LIVLNPSLSLNWPLHRDFQMLTSSAPKRERQRRGIHV
jgi:hypothetical protein